MNNMASSELVFAGWLLIILYMGVISYFVIRGAKTTKSISDYAVGSFAFSPVAVGLSLAAAMTSAATFIINPGFIALYGISGYISYGIVLPIAALGSLALLTKGFRKHGSNVKALSLSQWMGTRYQSQGFALFFAVLALLLITFIVLINVGLTKIISKTLNLNEIYVLSAIVIFVFGYMMFGGANSMVYTNAVQAGIMLVVAFILLGSGYTYFSDGVHGFLDKLATIDPKLTQYTNPDSFLFRDLFEIVFAQVVIGVAIVCQPHIITKSLFLKSERDVNRYLIVGIIAELLFFSVVFAGLYARLTFPDLSVNGEALKLDGILSAYVVSEFPVYVGLVVVLGLISAGLSTLEGLIQSLSTTVTTDLIQPVRQRFLSDAGKLNPVSINRLVITVLALISFLLSLDQLLNPKLSVAIFAQNGVYAYFAAAFVPILFGMFLPKAKGLSAIAASVTAIIVHFVMYYGKVPVPFTSATGENPAVAAAMAIISALIIGGILYLVNRRKNIVPD